MPERTFMVVDPRSDHSFRIPRPDQSLALGTPNTCTDCHEDRSASWALEIVKQWDGWAVGKARRARHFAPALADARSGERGAMRGLLRLAGDAQQPGIARATALELFRFYGPTPQGERVALIDALRDEDALVRATAAGELGSIPPALRVELATPLLSDPLRAVRIGAARSLASVPDDEFSAPARARFEAALAEYTDSLEAAGDLPSSHLNLGALAAQRGDTDAALRGYATALRLDPRFLPASMNLANLYNQLGRNADSEGVLRKAITYAPDEAELHYSLGLLLAEQNRLDEAAVELAAAAARMPERARFRYNHALALQQLGRRLEAGEELREALRLDPDDPDIVRALTIFYIQQNDPKRALPHARALAELTPGDPRARQLLQRIELELQMRGPR
jgi:tetratricopeptide (TPR) repeat protein